jgi:hypothetical protein
MLLNPIFLDRLLDRLDQGPHVWGEFEHTNSVSQCGEVPAEK